MSKNSKRATSSGRAKLLLGLAIGAVALGLALWGVPLVEVFEALASARLGWLVPVALIFLWQQLMRAWRQTIIIQAVAPQSTYRTNLSILCISFLAINTLPARLGEVVRPLLFLEREGIELGTGFALVFVERVLDLCATFLMLALVAWLVPVQGHSITVAGLKLDWVSLGRTAAATLLPAVLVALVMLLVFGRWVVDRLQPLAHVGPRPWRMAAALVLGFAGPFVRGLDALRSPGRVAAITAITVATWGGSIWMFPAGARAFGFGELLGYGQGMGVLSIVMLGGVVPAPPGMAGTYEAFVRAGLALYGVAGTAPPPAGGPPTLDSAAVAFALTMHWWVYIVQAATAAWFLAVDRVNLRRLLAEAREGSWRQQLGPAEEPRA